MTAAPPLITLTTDFGLHDEYLGALKGVLLSFLYEARIVDISHLIAPQDVLGASMVLAGSAPFFPDGTVHLVVVDPGVGSDRRILAIKTARHIFVGPDNGVFSPFLQTEPVVIHHITNSALFRFPVSPTFHGRDIMAPIAARLAGGMDISVVGPAVPLETCCFLATSAPVSTGGQLHGQIVSKDHFGNLRTNISKDEIANLSGAGELVLQAGGRTATGLHATYTEKRPGELIALIDSRGFLEIAVVEGNAAATTKMGVGDLFILSRRAC
jgi:S-adenosylmethionine hydrolase